ncbi:signal peptide plus GPI anchored membrane protein [Cryptosporidium felis]|nr:signal peptide plus GPI anchored membrane protein [Cryptosporidium felis]
MKDKRRSNPFASSLKKATILRKKKKEEEEGRKKEKREKRLRVREKHDKRRILLRKTRKGQPIFNGLQLQEHVKGVNAETSKLASLDTSEYTTTNSSSENEDTSKGSEDDVGESKGYTKEAMDSEMDTTPTTSGTQEKQTTDRTTSFETGTKGTEGDVTVGKTITGVTKTTGSTTTGTVDGMDTTETQTQTTDVDSQSTTDTYETQEYTGKKSEAGMNKDSGSFKKTVSKIQEQTATTTTKHTGFDGQEFLKAVSRLVNIRKRSGAGDSEVYSNLQKSNKDTESKDNEKPSSDEGEDEESFFDKYGIPEYAVWIIVYTVPVFVVLAICLSSYFCCCRR